jgi:AcrR family transcriptional regulator
MENLSKRDKERTTHEKEILTAAERVFCAKGYEAAGMDEIAKEARFTKRTVYQHFENKDDLYFAVVLGGLRKLMTRIREANKKTSGGYEKLETTCRTFDRFYRENPELARLMNYWGRTGGIPTENGMYQGELIRFNQEMIRDLADIIDEGKEDGSIQLSLGTEQAALYLMVLFTGFYNQFTEAGEQIKSFLSNAPNGFGDHTIELLIKPMKRVRSITATRKGTA